MSIIGLILSSLLTIQGLIITIGNPNLDMKMLGLFIITMPNSFFIALSIISLKSVKKM